MTRHQAEILVETLDALIESLTPFQKNRWLEYTETCTDGDVLDGINDLMHYINTGKLPTSEEE